MGGMGVAMECLAPRAGLAQIDARAQRATPEMHITHPGVWLFHGDHQGSKMEPLPGRNRRW